MTDIEQIREAIELLSSACEIARRRGEHTNWPAFLNCAEKTLEGFGLRGVTARTFRIIPEQPTEGN